MSLSAADASDVALTLGLDQANSRSRRRKIWAVAAGVAILLGVLAWVFWPEGPPKFDYRTAKVTRGELVVTVTATGQLAPLNQVEVGTEVSGTIRSVEVDDNDVVKKGEVLARIDTTRLAAQLLQGEAALASAKAHLSAAEADVLESEAQLRRLKRTWEVSGGKVPSQNDLDVAEAALTRNKGEALMAKAEISQAKASLEAQRYDFDKAIIRAPIDGIVLDRNVEPGQTVAASLQTPVLFTLAEDLSRMELSVNVDEADVGQVREGQQAVFTVDAYPDRKFPAKVTQVRFAAQTENGVVTYETLLTVDNKGLLLRPGMTATADITVNTIENALLAPNAALRFTPPEEAKPGKKRKRGFSLLPRRLPHHTKKAAENGDQPILWTPGEWGPDPVPVKTGPSNGLLTVVSGEGVEPGLEVILEILKGEK